LIAWFAGNPVAANLLMWLFVASGALTLLTLRQEEFPSVETETVLATVTYPGAAPEEVEGSVCLRLEEAIEGVIGIDRVATVAAEGACNLTITLVSGADVREAQGEIESRVSGITTLPDDAERPVVSHPALRNLVLEIALSGDASERSLKALGQRMRDDIAELPTVSQVDLNYARADEISIEVSEAELRRYGLTLERIADIVRRSSLDLPAGSLRTAGGEILLRTRAQAYRGEEFENIVVMTQADGAAVRLGDIARVYDGFEDSDVSARFDGKPAVMVSVYRVGEEDTGTVARSVRAYLEQAKTRIPSNIEVTIWQDRAVDLAERIRTMVSTAGSGLVLVLIILSLFLQVRIALWVAAGIPIALLGALAFFPLLGLTISTLTIIGFIVVLGIVVDDAIVVGERIHVHQEDSDEDPRVAAIRATSEVSVPVIFGVLTTIAAFLPFVLVPGRMGQFFGALGLAVILSLVMSVIESQLILPAHLGHYRRRERRHDEGRIRSPAALWRRVQRYVARGLAWLGDRVYAPALERVLEWRYLAASVGVGVMILTLSLFLSGRVRSQFFPAVEGNRLFATLTLPSGSPLEVTQAGVAQLEAAALALHAELDAAAEPGEPPIVQHILTSVGARVSRGGPPSGVSGGSGGSHLGEVALSLSPAESRSLGAGEIARRWRKLAGPVPDADELQFSATNIGAGSAIAIQLQGRDVAELGAAAAELKVALARYDGVVDISDSQSRGRQQVELMLRSEATTLGLSQQDLARQVRVAFFGAEVQRVQRGPEDVRVMVRYPESERHSLSDLETMYIRTPAGDEVPLSSVAEVSLGRGYSTIRRTDGQRVVNVTADIVRTIASPEAVLAGVTSKELPSILRARPGVSYSFEGEQRERSRAMGGLQIGFALSILAIYGLLAVPLRSYLQPLVIMSAIPFGVVGAVLGHGIMGRDIVFFSLLGIAALAGVVVNDSLVLVDYVNQHRARGTALYDAVRAAGRARMRAILLTSLTTAVGLFPLMIAKSPATFFVVPIAISLGFGVIVATIVTLFLVPCGYLIVEDFLAWLGVASSGVGRHGVALELPERAEPSPSAAGLAVSADYS
jgi:multidrug efflux pump subunit AcrB